MTKKDFSEQEMECFELQMLKPISLSNNFTDEKFRKTHQKTMCSNKIYLLTKTNVVKLTT